MLFLKNNCYLFIYACAGSSSLHGPFPSFGERGLPLTVVWATPHCGVRASPHCVCGLLLVVPRLGLGPWIPGTGTGLFV